MLIAALGSPSAAALMAGSAADWIRALPPIPPVPHYRQCPSGKEMRRSNKYQWL